MSIELNPVTETTVGYYADLLDVSSEGSLELCRPAVLYEEAMKGYLAVRQLDESPTVLNRQVKAATHYVNNLARLASVAVPLAQEPDERYLTDESSAIGTVKRALNAPTLARELVPSRVATGRVVSLQIQAIAPSELPEVISPPKRTFVDYSSDPPATARVEWDDQRELAFAISGKALIGSRSSQLLCGILTSTRARLYRDLERHEGGLVYEFTFAHALKGFQGSALATWQHAIEEARRQEAINRGRPFNS